MKSNIKKNFIWNSIGSLFNACTSLFFLIIVTRINGVDKAGIFTFAFTIACMLNILGVYSGRTYQVTEKSENIDDNDYLYSRIFTSILMIIFSITFSLIRGYNSYKTILIILLTIFKSIEAFCDVLYGIIQKDDKLYKVGISMLIKAFLGILVFMIIDLITNNILISCIGLIISNLLVILLYDIKNVKSCNFSLDKFNINNVIYILKFGFWAFLFSFLTQYVINAPKYAIDSYLSSEAQTIYGIISMPATVMVLCSQFLIQPFLKKLTESVKEKEYKKFNKLIIKLLIALLVIGVILLLATYILGIPILELIYSVKLDKYLIPLLIIITGSIFYGVTSILSNGLTTIRKTFIQSIIFIFVSLIAFILSNVLVKSNGIYGASIVYLLSMFILMLLYLIVYFIEISKLKKENNKVR